MIILKTWRRKRLYWDLRGVCLISTVQSEESPVDCILEVILYWIICLTDAYDALDPNGNITIRWDIMSWTPDGYVVSIMPFSVVDLALDFGSLPVLYHEMLVAAW